MFENFRMDSAIAACDATVEIGTDGNFASAGIYDPDYGVWIFDTTVPVLDVLYMKNVSMFRLIIVKVDSKIWGILRILSVI